mmetsp:Transcript_144505/g.402614  ORF Transcript_144505/g.402614 Transcript_144505/m.402614 type:complete len:365 (-) Transcript_144505:146-1240(-)
MPKIGNDHDAKEAEFVNYEKDRQVQYKKKNDKWEDKRAKPEQQEMHEKAEWNRIEQEKAYWEQRELAAKAFSMRAVNGANEARSRAKNPNQKVKFCMYHLQGVCKYTADTCAFAHSTEEMQRVRDSRRKRPTTTRNGAGPPCRGAGTREGPACTGVPIAANLPIADTTRALINGADMVGDCSGSFRQGSVQAMQTRSLWPALNEPMFVKPLAGASAEVPHPGGVPPMAVEQGFQYGLEALAMPYGHIDYCPAPMPVVGPGGFALGVGALPGATSKIFNDEGLNELSLSIQNLSKVIGKLTQQVPAAPAAEALCSGSGPVAMPMQPMYGMLPHVIPEGPNLTTVCDEGKVTMPGPPPGLGSVLGG